jgi:myo-inositol-1(or 4)-monophosphatase
MDLAELRRLATDVASEAGELLLGLVHETRTDVTTKSTGTDMVSEMDRASEDLIVSRILAARPDDAVVGEEGAHRPGSTPVRWVVDPLDGTTNYLYRLPGWSVSVGAEVDGAPAVGAVVVPSHGDTFSAATGLGATCNGRPVRLAPRPPPIAEALVGTGFAYDPRVRAQQAAFLVDLLPRVRDVRRVGAAAADLCALADGRLDAYFESGLAPWDRCAGGVIAREAGAVVEEIEDHPLPGLLTVATHPGIRDEFRQLLVDSGVLG